MEMIQHALAGHYGLIKFIHVFFVMTWAMSAVGAYVFYLRTAVYHAGKNPADPVWQARRIWAFDQWDKTVWLEHAALPIILVTGPLLFLSGGWSFQHHWLAWKLAIVILAFLPMEAVDIWVSHVRGPGVAMNREQSPEAWESFRAMQLKFYRIVSPIVRFGIPFVIFLAVAKPSL